MRKFIDIGVNLTDPMFTGLYHGKQVHPTDFHLVLERAKAAGLERLLITGTTLEDSKQAINMCKLHPEFLYATVGVHPTRSLEFDVNPDSHYSKLKDLINKNKDCVLAVGECGLDYDRLHFCPKAVQLKYFAKQLQLSKDVDLPLFLHMRNTGTDFIKVLFGTEFSR